MARDPLPDIEARHASRAASLAAYRAVRSGHREGHAADMPTLLDQVVASIDHIHDDLTELLAQNRQLRTAIYLTQQLVVQLTTKVDECVVCGGAGELDAEPCTACSDINFIRETLELFLQDLPEFDE